MTQALGKLRGMEPQLDNMVPSQGDSMPPAIVLCGARGGAGAIVPLLSGMPRDSGLAVIVSVDDPDLPAAMSALERDGIAVIQVRSPVRVEPGRVFVLPPAPVGVLPDGRLLPRDAAQPQAFPCDFLLRGLADVFGAHAAAVVLSGADGDAALGLKRIKERGGLTIAQDPDEADEPDMPRAAIATGMVDWVLPAAEMRQRLLDYVRIEHRIRLPAGADAAADAPAREEALLRDILMDLRTRTGRDFTQYKRATILRRIGRRMQVNRIESMQDYLAFLRTRTGETAALLRDLLISVTNFFRDPDCFAALELQIPELFRGKGPNDQVRVWVPACATGEEAYSIAMLLAEHARTLDAPPALQVFASDLDERALQEARDAIYPATIEADVSLQRLRRFFLREHRGWRVRRELREIVLFAQHDLLKDSPFSRLDLVSCRNLLIDLDREAQQRVLETFRFALLPHGRLFLGSSESVDDTSPLFTTLDKEHRLFLHRAAARAGYPVTPPRPAEIAQTLHAPVAGGCGLEQAPRGRPDPARPGDRLPSPGEVHLRLLEQLAPPSVLVNAEHDILHLSPGAGRYLRQAGGEPTRKLLQVVQPSLRIELRAALSQAVQSRAPVEVGGLAADVGGAPQMLAVRVVPASEVGEDLFLVVFRPDGAEGSMLPAQQLQSGADADPIARHLDRELERLKTHLRDTVEQYEASTEELKASNEELQAMNEELRSATEELETSREELQSINEELTTVNNELKAKIDELAHANSDLHNLMDATDIATVFLDRELCVTRYTPAAVKLFKLIPSDAGRPLTDLTTQLSYPDLAADALRVLDRLVPIERELGHQDGAWYLARVLPYRTFDRIAGVVLSFVDITERRRAEEVRTWLSTVVGSSMDAILSFGLDLTVRSWNPAAERIFGYTAAESIGQSLALIAASPAEEAEQQAHVRALARGESLQYEATRVRKDGDPVRIAFTVAPIRDAEGRVIGGTAMARDVTEARRAQEALELSQAELTVAMRELEAADRAKDRFIAVLSHELRNPLASMASAVEVLADARPGTPMRDRALEIVRRQTATMRQLLEDLLDVTRLRLGKLSLRPSRISLREVVAMADDTVRSLVRDRGHQLDIELPPQDVRLDGDKVRIAQVITNLLGNAAKYTPPGGHIRLVAQAHDRELQIAVEDTGIGLDRAELEQVFGLFVQAPHGGEATATGLGIGLALARSIAEMHGGTLRAESEGHGKGSRFIFTLPVEDAPTPPPASSTPAPSARGSGTLLIVDDNADALWGLGTVLERAGYRVLTADTAAQGLALGGQARPDAMLLDIGLPDMTGLELARRVRATPWGAKAILIALTGLGQESDVRKSREAGFDAHLTKPADVAQLRRLLGELRRSPSV